MLYASAPFRSSCDKEAFPAGAAMRKSGHQLVNQLVYPLKARNINCCVSTMRIANVKRVARTGYAAKKEDFAAEIPKALDQFDCMPPLEAQDHVNVTDLP